MKRVYLAQGVSCALSGVAIVVYRSYPDQFVRLCEEDGIVENLTALCFLFAGIAFLYLLRSPRFLPVFSIGLGMLCIGAAGEEISWGQRIFGISTPEAISEVNVQHEFNIHNLQWLQGQYRLIALVFILFFCILLPAAIRYVSIVRHYSARFPFPAFPPIAVPTMLMGIAFMAAPRLLHIVNYRDLDEVGELLVAFGFLLYAIAPESPPAGRDTPLPQEA